jgi:type VI secretion system secreted protein VgrG
MHRAPAAQAGNLASVTTPFGDDTLLLDGFAGREAISELFRFDLRMRSADKALDASRIVGQRITVTLQQPGGPKRFFNGIVTRFAHAGADSLHGFYTAELAPRLWLLTLGRDRAIYQNLTALQIVEKLLGAFGIPFESSATASRFPVREYCVQYDESPFAFISRLMEEEGIFYFFRFADGSHTMVLADSPSAHVAEPGGATLWAGDGARPQGDTQLLTHFEMARQLGPANHLLADYDPLQAQTSQGSAEAAAAAPGVRQYIFPGRHKDAAEAARKAAVRVAAQQAEARTGVAQSMCAALAAGAKFTLADHVDAALNIDYVVRAVEHSVAGEAYGNRFTVFPLAVPFRAPLATPRPAVSGTHTATVVGSQGEEIWTDAHGRIKIKFHWDQAPGANQDSSCWVRVAQSSAGQGWGHLFLPRVGHEVVVSYVDGDPDRPLVTGSVYNLQSTLPVALPANQTQSVMRSRTSKTGTAGNELRMEDKAGAEELYLRAQRDMTVSVQNKLATTVVQGGESHLVQGGDRAVEVQSGNETHKVKGTRKVEVTGDETRTNSAAFTQEVSGNYKLKVSGNLVIDVSGAITIKSGTGLQLEAGTTLGAKAGTTLTAEAMTVKHKATAAQTLEAGALLELKGALVKLN